jgi:hypothetical protein
LLLPTEIVPAEPDMVYCPIRSRAPVGPNLCAFALCALAIVGSTALAAPPTFEHDIRPILKAYCLDCHGGGDTVEANLDLRLARFAVRGGDSGPAVVSGKGGESLLVTRLKSGEMPPGEKKVPAEEIAKIAAWIDAGIPTEREEPESLPPGIDITPQERAYWFYQPIARPEPPVVEQTERVRTPIDAFILARLHESNLDFAPDADSRTLLLRASLDLTGLPPTKEQLDTFVANPTDAAYEQALDQLLASPHYGERWGRHWLDVAGYADSDGNGNQDSPRAYAYKYRDYVIRAFNADKPLDQFVLEQLAGDELVPLPWSNLTAEQAETLAATGFLRMAVDNTQGSADEQEAANQVVADTIKIVSSSLLGLTVGCAQCHDHRYDPIPQSDYYRMRAVFAPFLDTSKWRRPAQRLVSLYTDADREKAAAIDAEANKLQEALTAKTQTFLAEALEKELLKFPEDQRVALRDAWKTPEKDRTEEQKKLLDANPSVKITAGVLYQYNQPAADELKKDAEQVAAKRAEKPPEDFVAVASEVPGAIPATHLFHRGDYRQPKQEITPGDLTIAAPDGARVEIPADDTALATSGRRLAYARHLMSGRHPLVGRVLANRIWLHHFGRGIVNSPGDFGILGERPSHPELLDWLAVELADQKWSMKRIHKLIMLSTVYRQSSVRSSQALAADGENRLLSHYPLRRLDAEVLRDRMLVAAGRLDTKQFGPPVPVDEDFVGQVLPAGDSPRRSVYLQVRRSKPVSLLTAFDSPVMAVNCDKRITSTSAPQSLMLMNSEFVLAQAKAMAKRLSQETPAGFADELTQPIAASYASPTSAWQYGFGTVDEMQSATASFAPLPHWTGSAWQGGPALPDANLGWVLLHGQGGHTGENPSHQAIRRWTSPVKGTVRITGKLSHGAEAGDGVRGRIVASRGRLAGSWTVKASEASTPVESLAVEAGDTVDFVVDAGSTVTSDSFVWTVELAISPAAGGPARTWSSAGDFAGPITLSPLSEQVAWAWQIAYGRLPSSEELAAACAFVVERMDDLPASGEAVARQQAALTALCQQLLSSNEFLYVE